MPKPGFPKSALLAATILLAIASWLTSAMAATTTATFSVSATVQPGCLISTNPLAFGIYNGLQVDATTTLTITCTNSTPYDVGLDPGAGHRASVLGRSMQGPGNDQLDYGLYQDAGRTLNWGETIGVDTVPGIGTGAAQTLTVYGRVTAGQSITPGSYTDTITATLTY